MSFYNSNHHANGPKRYDYNLPSAKPVAFNGERRRGITLNLLLALICCVTLVFLVVDILDFYALDEYYGQSGIPSGAVTEAKVYVVIGFILGLAQFIFAVALWNFRGWGYYGLTIGYLMSSGLNMCNGYVIEAALNIVIVCILSSRVSRIQHLME